MTEAFLGDLKYPIKIFRLLILADSRPIWGVGAINLANGQMLILRVVDQERLSDSGTLGYHIFFVMVLDSIPTAVCVELQP